MAETTKPTGNAAKGAPDSAAPELVNKNPGNFANNPDRAREAGRKGGQKSGGNFKNNPDRAREAGRKGGKS